MKQGLSCPSCGSPITQGYKFCGTCGRPLYQPIPESANYNYVIEPPARKGGGIVGVIRKIFGGLLIGMAILFNWILRIALFVALCFYVVEGFITGGLWAGLLSIFIGGICVTIGYFLFGWISIGLGAIGAALWGE
ncbi:zinc ribbon domain-containing protein [bacterium]|nr:MAG: zinc ribbon domain-containing protein [bacterium]